MTNSDPGVVTKIARDPDAFESFYRDHIEAIGRFIARRVDDPSVVADLTSEVFIAAVEAAARYQPERGSPTGWLYGIARNVVADHLRRHAREHKAARRLAGRRVLEPDALARIEERIDAERVIRSIYHAMAKLPERDRRLLELVAIDGLSVVDAAAVLGLSPGTARVRLHRSRARFDHFIAAAGHPSPLHSLEAT